MTAHKEREPFVRVRITTSDEESAVFEIRTPDGLLRLWYLLSGDLGHANGTVDPKRYVADAIVCEMRVRAERTFVKGAGRASTQLAEFENARTRLAGSINALKGDRKS